ncbi:MAG: histidine phosphatase family protein [Pseudomonadota bacterium]
MRLILIRHPRPLVTAGLCYGSTDLPVAPAELARARAALAATLPADLPLFSSPLQRCADLARQLPCSALCFDPRLVEMDFGRWEMRAWDDIARAEIDAWADDVAGYRPGGGETVLEVASRVSAFYADVRQAGIGSAIVLCHAGTMRLLAACHAGLAPPDMAAQAAAAPHAIAYGASITLA